MRVGDLKRSVARLRREARGSLEERQAWNDIEAIRLWLEPEIIATREGHEGPVPDQDEAKVRARLQELAKLDPEPDGPDGVHSMASLLLGDVEAPLLP